MKNTQSFFSCIRISGVGLLNGFWCRCVGGGGCWAFLMAGSTVHCGVSNVLVSRDDMLDVDSEMSAFNA